MKTKNLFLISALLILVVIGKVHAQNNIVTSVPNAPAATGNQNVAYGVDCGTNTQPDPTPTFPGTGTNNSFFGFRSGFNTTFGQSNTFLGSQSGMGNLEGTDNVFIGMQSGITLQNGTRNTFIGSSTGTAFNNQQSWQSNTFIGALSGVNFTSGDFNTFIGAETARGPFAPTRGSFNTFIGYQAGFSSTGNGNVYIGGQAGSLLQNSENNVQIGANAGRGAANGVLYTARRNVFIGTSTGINIDGGVNNVFMGFQSGIRTQGTVPVNGEGSGNVFLGAETGSFNVEGRENVYIGNSSGQNNTGSGNVFIGTQSGLSYTVMHNHLAIDNSPTTTPLIEGDFGAGANLPETLTFNVDETTNSTVIINANGTHAANTQGLSALQFADLNNTHTAIDNTTNKILSVDINGNVILVKDKEGVANAGITNSCSVNNFVPKSNASGNLTCSQIYDNWNGNNTVIGKTGVAIGWASPTAGSNFLYDVSNGPYPASEIELPLPAGRLKLLVNGNEKVNGIFFTSDANYKTQIGGLDKPLDKILRLKGVHYYWDVNNNPDMNFDSNVHTGFIAQEVEGVLPHLVITQSIENDKGEKVDRKSVNYVELIPYLVEAIKTQNEKINALQSQVNCLNERIGCFQSQKNSTIIKYGNTKIINVSPNPSSDRVTVSLNIENEVESAVLQVYDINGKLLNTLNVKERGTDLTKTFQKDNFGTGVYIISLVINDNSIDSKKIIFN